jgi:hypothetical protein
MSATQQPVGPNAAPPNPANGCGNCRYAQNRSINDNRVHCRRYPPPWTGHQGYATAVMVEMNDWCGEYQQGTPADPTYPLPLNRDVPFAYQEGNVVNCTMGNWTNEPESYAYQWKTGPTNIGAGGPSYIVTSADVGRTVNCVVTATNPGGSVSAPPSNSVTIVDPGP